MNRESDQITRSNNLISKELLKPFSSEKTTKFENLMKLRKNETKTLLLSVSASSAEQNPSNPLLLHLILEISLEAAKLMVMMESNRWE